MRVGLCVCLVLASTAAFAADSQQIIERYKKILAEKPVEGVVLDRLWKIHSERSATAELLADYASQPESFAASLVHGHLLRRAGKMAEAESAYKHAATINPTSPLPYLALARLFSDQTKPAAAAASLENALSRYSGDDPALNDTLLQLGKAWFDANEPQKALDAWERALAANPENLQLRQQLAEIYEQHGFSDKALPHYIHISEHGTPQERVRALQRMARIHQLANSKDKAIAALDQALALTAPGNWLRNELQSQLIRLYQRYGRIPELEERWRKAAADNPRDLGAQLQLHALYEQTGEIEKQRVALERILAFAPNDKSYKLKLADVLMHLNELPAAARLLEELLGNNPGNVEISLRRTEIELRRNEPAAAEARLKTLLAHTSDPHSQEKIVKFASQNRLPSVVEQHLKAHATAGGDGAVALAEFYAATGSMKQARATFEQLVESAETAEQKASALQKLADFFKQHNQAGAAMESLQRAMALQPQSAELRLALSDLFVAANELDRARQELEQLVELPLDEATLAAADRKLFQLLQTIRMPEQSEPSGIGRREMLGVIAPFSDPLLKNISQPLRAHIDQLQETADRVQGPAAYVRLARWQLWSRLYRAAVKSAEAALVLDPESTSAYEIAIEAALAEGLKMKAREHLTALIKLDKSNERRYRKQLAQLEFETGSVDSALATLQEVVRTNPGDVQALTDLALMQQQGDHWYDALATWERALEATPPQRKHETLQPLLRVYERLGMHQRAVEAVAATAVNQSEAESKARLLSEVHDYSLKHNLIGWLKNYLQQQRQRAPADLPFATALARIFEEEKRPRQALDLLREVSFITDDEKAAVEKVVALAADLGDFEEAIQQQQRLVVLTATADATALERLAALEESDLRDATGIWQRILTRFPRDVDVLRSAAKFYERNGMRDRAQQTYEQLLVLDPTNAQALWTAAALSAENGDRQQARQWLRQLIENTSPQKNISVTEPPVSLFHREETAQIQPRKRQRRAVFVPQKMQGTDLRLSAIRSLAETISPEEKTRWIERWHAQRKSAPAEALWALHFAGATDLALAHLLELMKPATGSGELHRTFIILAIQGAEFETLREWLDDQGAEIRSMFLMTMDQLIQAPEKVPAGLVEMLESVKSRQLTWEASTVFARHQHLGEAIRLGRRVFEGAATYQPDYGLELASWHIAARQIEEGKAVLHRTMEGASMLFQSPQNQALRAYYWLLPETAREQFVELVTRRPGFEHTVARIISFGLEGEMEQAQQQIEQLLEKRALPLQSQEDISMPMSVRYWNFILAGGHQLQAWGLDELADFLWETALKDDAWVQLQDEHALPVIRELRLHLLARQIATADTADVSTLIATVAQTMPPDSLSGLASILERNAHLRLGAMIYNELCELEPRNFNHLRSLAHACRAVGEAELAINAFKRALGDGPAGVPTPVYIEWVRTLCTFLEIDSRDAEAREVLNFALSFIPDERELLERLAQLYRNAAEWDAAATIYRQLMALHPNNPEQRIALADVLEAQDKVPEAIALLEKSRGAAIERKLAELYIKAGEIEKSHWLCNVLLRQDSPDAAQRCAMLLAHSKHKDRAMKLLRAVEPKAWDVNTIFFTQLRIVQLAEGNDQLFAREMRRLRAAAGNNPSLLRQYYRLRIDSAQKEQAIAELTEAWKSGEAAAAEGLVDIYIRANDESALRKLIDDLLSTESADVALLRAVNEQLQRARKFALAVAISDRLVKILPSTEAILFGHARNLHGAGKDPFSLLEQVGARHPFNENIAGQVAQTFLQLKNPTAARDWFEIATQHDPSARRYPYHLQYARLLLEDGEVAKAKELLEQAFSNDMNGEYAELVHFMEASGRNISSDQMLRDFGLRGSARRGFLQALFSHHAQNRQATEATALCESHPEIIDANVAGQLRTLANRTGQFAAVAGILEPIAQEKMKTPVVEHLAFVYSDWAESELARDQQEAALEHLHKANHLAPAEFSIADKLAQLHVRLNNAGEAIQVLERFIENSSKKVDRERAQQLIFEIQSS